MKKQTRRTVSMKGTTYAALHAFCEARGLAMSALVEELIAKLLEPPKRSEQPRPTPAPAPWRSTGAF